MNARRFTIKETGDKELPVAAFIDGVDYPRATLTLSYLRLTKTEASFRNEVKALSCMINSEGQIIDSPEGPYFAMEQEPRWARHSHIRYLESLGSTVKPIRGRGGYTVSCVGSAATPARATTAVRNYLNAQVQLGLRDGQNMAELDGLHLLTDAQKWQVFNKAAPSKSGQHRHDNGAYFRFGARAHILRTDAIFCADAIETSVAGAPLVVRLSVGLMRDNALRARREACGLTMYGLHKGGGLTGPDAFAFNKGDRAEPTKRFRMRAERWADMQRYIDGERRALDFHGRGLEEFRELSRRANLGDRAAEVELRATPVFLVRGGRRLTYDNLVGTYVRPLLRAAGVCATLHMLRHEFVYNHLREIEAMEIPEREKQRKRLRLARTMGWNTGEAMFRVYDAYERERLRIEDLVAVQLRQDRGISAAQQLRGGLDGRPRVIPGVDAPSRPRARFLALGRAANA